MMRRRKALSALDDDGHAIAWPIPIWRPRSTPLVPVHRRVLNLLSPRPRLSEGEAVPVPLRPAGRVALGPPRPSRLGGQGEASGHVWARGAADGRCEDQVGRDKGEVRARTDDYSRESGVGQRLSGSCESSPTTTYAVTTPTITITPTLDSPPESRGLYVEDKAIRRPRSHGSLLPVDYAADRPTRAILPARLDYGARLPTTPSSAPPTRTRYPSDSSHTPSVSPTLHTDIESYEACTPIRRPAGSPCQQTAEAVQPYPSRILHLLRLRHSLDLARQLLYAYNRVALLALSSAPFPKDVQQEWEHRLDGWWAQTSGVLNAAHARVRVVLRQVEAAWVGCIRQAGGNARKAIKLLAVVWSEEEKPVWDETGLRTRLTVGQLRASKGESRRRREKLERLVKQPDSAVASLGHMRVPGWVVDVVPEPFGADEVEEEVWELESRGRVPTGTFSRMRARGMIGAAERYDYGLGGADDFGLSAREEMKAAEMGLRTVDLDAAQKAERADWRRKYRNRWSSFL